MQTINIESGMPTVEQARERLKTDLLKAKKENKIILKIIHGYGSTGKGGKLKGAIRKSLVHRRKEKIVKTIIWGEYFTTDKQDTRALLQRHPSLKSDKDLNRMNEGVTIVELA
ncbi:MAG: Smr/MutS family protein [Ignavibacteriaceae bacterium]